MRHILRSFSMHDVPPSFKPLVITTKLAQVILNTSISTQTQLQSATASTWASWARHEPLVVLQSCKYHLETVWLFTFSDLKTIVGPKTALGIFMALCVCTFAPDRHECLKEQQRSTTFQILMRTPLVAFWVWINLLPFNISNQRQPESILEDSLNKPWRPLPSNRLSPTSARRFMLGAYLCAFLVSTHLGGLEQHLALIALGVIYNDLGAADISWLSRNLVNGLGFVAFGSGAFDVALGGTLAWTARLTEWFVIIAAVVTSTVQTQDLYDQVGDARRARLTMPLCLGDGLTRCITAVTMSFWTLVCLRYWDLPAPALGSVGGAVTAILLCFVTVARTICLRSQDEDKKTFRVWTLWMVSIYFLPLVRYVICR